MGLSAATVEPYEQFGRTLAEVIALHQGFARRLAGAARPHG